MSGRATVLEVPGGAEAELLDLAAAIFPLPRSLTGNGVRRTLEAVSRWAPLELTEVPAGTPVFDWVVPPEWNVREAWIADESGRRLVDFADSSLHVVGYSEPVRVRLRGERVQVPVELGAAEARADGLAVPDDVQ